MYLSAVVTRIIIRMILMTLSALLNLVWARELNGVGVDGGEVELAGNEEQHGAHCGKTGVAAGFAFGRLEEAVKGLDEAIGLTGLGPGDNTVEMATDHAGDVLHWLDPGTQDVGATLLEHGGDDIDLLAVEDGSQSFPVEPGAGGAFGGGVADQGIEVG